MTPRESRNAYDSKASLVSVEAPLFVDGYHSSSRVTTPPDDMESNREGLGAFGNRSREFAGWC